MVLKLELCVGCTLSIYSNRLEIALRSLHLVSVRASPSTPHRIPGGRRGSASARPVWAPAPAPGNREAPRPGGEERHPRAPQARDQPGPAETQRPPKRP